MEIEYFSERGHKNVSRNFGGEIYARNGDQKFTDHEENSMIDNSVLFPMLRSIFE